MAEADERRRKGSGFGLSFMTPLVLGAALNPLNSSALATALTPIGRAFPDDPAAAAWLIASLYLSAAIAQPVLGRVADLFGPRRTLAAGMVLVCLGGLIGAFAPGMGMLVLSRVIIGVGTSAGYPCALAMIRARATVLGVPAPSRTLAVLSVAGNVSGTLGPPLGGLIVATLGWRWIFVINLPLALIGLLLTVRNLPPDPPPRRIDLRTLDLPGMALFSGAVVGVMLFLMALSERFDPSPLAVGAGLLAALVLVELRRSDPFIDVRMLARNSGLRAIYLRHTLTCAMTYAVFYSLPQWMQQAKGLPPGQTGLMMVPYALSGAVATFLVTRPRSTALRWMLGCGALGAGCVWLLTLDGGVGPWALPAIISLFGLASGAISMFNQQGLLWHAPPEQMGAAAGLFRTAQYCGAMGAAALTSFVVHAGADDAAIHRLALIFLPMAAALIALLIVDRGERERA